MDVEQWPCRARPSERRPDRCGESCSVIEANAQTATAVLLCQHSHPRDHQCVVRRFEDRGGAAIAPPIELKTYLDNVARLEPDALHAPRQRDSRRRLVYTSGLMMAHPAAIRRGHPEPGAS